MHIYNKSITKHLHYFGLRNCKAMVSIFNAFYFNLLCLDSHVKTCSFHAQLSRIGGQKLSLIPYKK